MLRWIGMVSLLVITLVGWLAIRRRIVQLASAHEFADEFLSVFSRWADGALKDDSEYVWLINRSPRMQSAMGRWGILAAYKEPFVGIHRNYPVILNMIPSLRREARDVSFHNHAQIAQLLSSIGESVVRYQGNLEDEQRELIDRQFNLLFCYGEGVRSILAIPLSALAEAGLISAAMTAALRASLPMRVASMVIAALGAIGSIVGLVVDWPRFFEMLNSSINLFPH